jgi:hypothetical protein
MKPALSITVSAGLAIVLAARPALAFCRATTCDPSVPAQGCQKDAQACLITGQPLFWPSDCLQIGINQAGSPKHGISFDQLKASAESAFQSWTNADCAGKKPSIRVEIVGPIACDQREYNSDAGNVNLVVFRDDGWPYPGAIDALGRTSVRFNTETGKLLDADIEINGTTAGPITLDGSGADLLSILTHEAGHAFGLDHTLMAGSTMMAGYTAEDTSLRTLETDDVAGICALFPPGRTPSSSSCEPAGGFSSECGGYIEPGPVDPPAPSADGAGGGCTLSRSRTPDADSLVWMLALLSTLARRQNSKSRVERNRCTDD